LSGAPHLRVLGRVDHTPRTAPEILCTGARFTHQGQKPDIYPCFGVAAEEVAEELKTPSFRGMFFAEESLFSWVSIEEGFLALLGMTENATFFAACEAATHKAHL